MKARLAVGRTALRLLAAFLLAPMASHAQDGERPGFRTSLAAEVGGDLLTAVFDGPRRSPAGHFGLRGRIGTPDWGLHLQAEKAYWPTPEAGRTIVQSTVNLALGGDHVYADGHLRSALSAGISVLARGNEIDEPGTVGLFIDLRPVGFRWRLGRHLVIGLEPLHFALVAPVLRGIPLLDVQYRTTFYVGTTRF